MAQIRLRGRMEVGPETRRSCEQSILSEDQGRTPRAGSIYSVAAVSCLRSVSGPAPIVDGADANFLADRGTPNPPESLIGGHRSDADANKETISSVNAICDVKGGQPNGNGYRDGACTHPYPNRCGPTGRGEINGPRRRPECRLRLLCTIVTTFGVGATLTGIILIMTERH